MFEGERHTQGSTGTRVGFTLHPLAVEAYAYVVRSQPKAWPLAQVSPSPRDGRWDPRIGILGHVGTGKARFISSLPLSALALCALTQAASPKPPKPISGAHLWEVALSTGVSPLHSWPAQAKAHSGPHVQPGVTSSTSLGLRSMSTLIPSLFQGQGLKSLPLPKEDCAFMQGEAHTCFKG